MSFLGKDNGLGNQILEQTQAGLRLVIEKVNKHYRFLVTLLLTLTASTFFLVIGFPELFRFVPIFSQRFFGITIVGLIFLITFGGCYFFVRDPLKSVSIWLRSNLLILFSFAYYLRINGVTVNLLGYSVSTAFVFVFLILLIAAVNWNLFGKDTRNLLLIVPQVIIYTVHTYSFINLLSEDRTNLRIFLTDWLAGLFTLNNSVWILFASLAVAMITILALQLDTVTEIVFFTGILFLILWQIMFAIHTLTFLTYWYQALLFLVFWDFMYQPIVKIAEQVKDPKYQPKLVVSAIYHAVLFIMVIVQGYFVFVL